MNPEAYEKLMGKEAVAYVHSLMKRAVEERGEDYVYDSEAEGVVPGEINSSTCAYVARDAHRVITGPSCIIGHVLYYMGVSLEDLATNEGFECVMVIDDLVLNHNPAGGLPNRNLVGALRSAQVEQDAGNTWGIALRVFERDAGIRTFTHAERQQMVGRSNG